MTTQTKFIIATGLVVIIIALLGQLGSVIETDKVMNTETIEVEKVVDALEVRVKEAQDLARSEIESKAQQAYDTVIAAEMKAVEDKIKIEYIAEVEKTIENKEY